MFQVCSAFLDQPLFGSVFRWAGPCIGGRAYRQELFSVAALYRQYDVGGMGVTRIDKLMCRWLQAARVCDERVQVICLQLARKVVTEVDLPCRSQRDQLRSESEINNNMMLCLLILSRTKAESYIVHVK